ncbi:hypothetical protein PR048_021937 [Dryococelus australis]|uniref:Uncharacterized protein n=1 Tax=Dryococelus australis TaxID=614101 RepID=A0ABQ9GZP4_9NEOP|nr:hypothetical protein PR048_021937 [Dryococelus australis]
MELHRGKREISEKAHRPAASFGTIPICENQRATRARTTLRRDPVIFSPLGLGADLPPDATWTHTYIHHVTVPPDVPRRVIFSRLVTAMALLREPGLRAAPLGRKRGAPVILHGGGIPIYLQPLPQIYLPSLEEVGVGRFPFPIRETVFVNRVLYAHSAASIYFHKRERLAMNRARKRVTLPRSFGRNLRLGVALLGTGIRTLRVEENNFRSAAVEKGTRHVIRTCPSVRRPNNRHIVYSARLTIRYEESLLMTSRPRKQESQKVLVILIPVVRQGPYVYLPVLKYCVPINFIKFVVEISRIGKPEKVYLANFAISVVVPSLAYGLVLGNDALILKDGDTSTFEKQTGRHTALASFPSVILGDDAAGGRVFSGISRFHRPFIPARERTSGRCTFQALGYSSGVIYPDGDVLIELASAAGPRVTTLNHRLPPTVCFLSARPAGCTCYVTPVRLIAVCRDRSGARSPREPPSSTCLFEQKCPVASISSSIRDQMILVPNQDPFYMSAYFLTTFVDDVCRSRIEFWNRHFRRFEMNIISISSKVLNLNGATVFCVDLRCNLGSSFEPRWCNRVLVCVYSGAASREENGAVSKEVKRD